MPTAVQFVCFVVNFLDNPKSIIEFTKAYIVVC